MILPNYSITKSLYLGHPVSKLISSGIVLSVLYLNLPSSADDLFSQMNVGVSSAIVESLFIVLLTNNNLRVRTKPIFKPDIRLSEPYYSFNALSFLFRTIIASIDEEIATRGLLQPLIKIILVSSKYFSIVVSSIIFALQHDPEWTTRFAPLLVGIMCGYLYENYGLFASIAAHSTHNTVTGLFEDILPYIILKLEQICAVQEQYKPLETSKLDKADVKNYINCLMGEKSDLETENNWLYDILQTKKETDNFCDKGDNTLRDNPDLLMQHNQNLLQDNQKLKEASLKKLSQSNIYKFYGFFYHDKSLGKQKGIMLPNKCCFT